MPCYIALLRAVNVGGTGKLPMADLKHLCETAGLEQVRTYIASGNVVFNSSKSAAAAGKLIEESLEAFTGKHIDVFVRTAQEMAAVLASSPYSSVPGNLVMTIFLGKAPPRDAIRHVANQNGEQIALGKREIYVHYPAGVGGSKLRIPAARDGTARNMNTVAKLAAMAAEQA